MPVFKGILSTSNTSDDSQVFNIPATIKSFYLYNEFAGDNGVTISIFSDSLTEEIIIYYKLMTINESYSTNIPVLILPGYQIRIAAPKDLNYYFTIE